MLTSWLDGTHVNLGIAFLAGVITFGASCFLPLVPTYLAYLSGVSLSVTTEGRQRWQILKVAFLFVLGFVASFVVLGLAAQTLLGPWLQYRWGLEKIAGLVFIALGLFQLGWWRWEALELERRWSVPVWLQAHRSWQALVTGLAFGSGWTPCIGPVLAVVLYWAARQETVAWGTMLLIAYGLGLGAPFLVIAAFFERAIPWLKRHKQLSQWSTLISGIIILLSGLMMVLGLFRWWSMWVLTWLHLPTLAI